jgi:ABC-type Fe3+/spermidine/putrescine transport system ATPase subunit
VLLVEDLTKWFGHTLALDGVSLTIQEGELFTILGPSGCGKTTALRIVAGLERPDRGEVAYKQQTLVSASQGVFVPPERRGLGMVFQSAALWPHMTVFENVAYPLKLRRLPADLVRQKVAAVLRLAGLEGLERRPAPLLSGGQQQRVALARALVYEPGILLLDEPFSNLDAKLRKQMGAELKALQAALGVTTIYVTHDQAEALTLSDRIAVMNHGRVEQVAGPQAIYRHPATPFVRDFVGRTVVLEGHVNHLGDGRARIALTRVGRAFTLDVVPGARLSLRPGERVRLAVRPEDIDVVDGAVADPNDVLRGTVDTLAFGGDRVECGVRVGEERFLLFVPRTRRLEPGADIALRIDPETVTVWRE